MKRSNKAVMGKDNSEQLPRGIRIMNNSVLTLCVGMTLFSFFDFSEKQRLRIYLDDEDCSKDNTGLERRCRNAYQQALDQWQIQAPRYTSLSDCEFDFGRNSCVQLDNTNFIPRMKGFALAEPDSDDLVDTNWDFYNSRSLSYSTRGKHKMQWVNASGETYAKFGEHTVKVDKDWYQSPKRLKGNAKVLGRGGFGKIARSASRGS